MSQLREQQLQQQLQQQQQSPRSITGMAADLGSVTGTPNRMIVFSPSAKSVKSASKIMQTPERDDLGKGLLVFSPTHSSGGGFRTTGLSVDKDPFLSPSSLAKINNNQQLSATASSFRPFYDSLSSDGSEDNHPRAGEEKGATQFSEPNQISPILSVDLLLSRCVEFSCMLQNVSATDIETFLTRLASLGSTCHGTKAVFSRNNKVFVRYNNIRDACVSHRNVHLCGPSWTAKFISPPEFVQIAASGDIFASAHEGQLDMLAVLLHNAPMDLSQVEPQVFKLLKAEGDLFAFQKDRRSEEGALKAIIEYADITVAMNVASKLNGLMIDGLHIRLSIYQPDLHTGRAAPLNDGIATPMPTPSRYIPPGGNVLGYQGQPDIQHQKSTTQHGSNSLAPARLQPTPPNSGVGAPPQQVALVPMVFRNPYAPGAPIILDPYAPPGTIGSLGAMGAMGGTPMQSIVSQSAGFDIGQRSGVLGRYGNRRGQMRMDRTSQFGPNGHHNQVDVQRIRDGVDVRTTLYYTVGGCNPELAGREEDFPGPDNPSKMKRSCENAEHVGQ
ncbi:hypothetical protein SEPCBS119000_000069 [Sporothrix epigloea]|uniref:RNA-binding protein n=1 Tax=Sporothrix epigloea TaxID=1892477 RepID=A0ABP0D4V1_9PEZI